MDALKFEFREGEWSIGGRPLLMGVVNVTPDSFSDGGEFLDPRRAVERAMTMVEEGVDIIDVGGESTRPDAPEIPAAEEIRRLCPAIAAIAKNTTTPISVDTRKSAVAAAAIEAGARMVNDVSGFAFDDRMVEVIKSTSAGYIGMHMRGIPETMQTLTDYDDILSELVGFFQTLLDYAAYRGVPQNRIVIDPGIGFGKTAEQNLTILRNLETLRRLGRPILVGASRKSFIGKVLDIEDPKRRGWGHAAVAALAVYNGAAILRVHDVRETRQVVDMAAAIRDAED